MTTLDIVRLTPQERLDLIGALWDSLASQDIRLTAAQEAELGRRMATFDDDAKDAVAWEVLEAAMNGPSRGCASV